MNKVNFNIEYDVKPGTQINIVIVEALPESHDDDGGPAIGFHADLGLEEDSVEELEEIEDDEEEEEDKVVVAPKTRKKKVVIQ